MSQYKLTITGTLDTFVGEETIRRDFPTFVEELSQVHGGIVRDSIALVSVERMPDPEPPVAEDDTVDVTDPMAAVLAALNAVNDRLTRAGL